MVDVVRRLIPAPTHVRQHERRLRDLEKLNHDAEVSDARSELVTWRGLLFGLSIILVIVIVWLAREVRMRRILAHVLNARNDEGEEVKRE